VILYSRVSPRYPHYMRMGSLELSIRNEIRTGEEDTMTFIVVSWLREQRSGVGMKPRE